MKIATSININELNSPTDKSISSLPKEKPKSGQQPKIKWLKKVENKLVGKNILGKWKQ